MLHLATAQTWIPKLLSALRAERKKRSVTLTQIGDMFGDPYRLARYYIQPLCQHNNPAIEDRDIDAVVCSDAFATLEAFFARCDTAVNSDGRRQMFVLADAGMGKTSLLVMLRLAHLCSFWPRGYKCALLKLGTDTIDDIAKLEDHAHTVLLLDSLDEDPTAIGRISERISELLARTDKFHAVVITCRTQYFPAAESDPLERLGSVRVGGYRCPIIYLSPFNDDQVYEYLCKRFPRNFWRWLQRKDDPRHIAAQRILKKTRTLHLRPMLLAYIDDLVGKDSERELSAYEAFDILVQEWLEREVRRGRVESKEALYAACAAVAKRLDKLDKRTLSREELMEVCLEEPRARNVEMIDLGGRTLLNMTSAGAFRFAHFALQEFVLAKEIVQNNTLPIAIKITKEEAIFSVGSNRLHVHTRPSLDKVKDKEYTWKKTDKEDQQSWRTERMSVRGTTELISFILETRRIERLNFLVKFDAAAPPGTLQPIARPFPRELADFILIIDNVEFRHGNFAMINFCYFRFYNCVFQGASFAGSDLRSSCFVNCDMRSADFSRSRLSAAVISRVDLDGSIFAGADLSGADLSAVSQTALAEGASFAGALYDELTKWPTGFDCNAAGAVDIRNLKNRDGQLEGYAVSQSSSLKSEDNDLHRDRGPMRTRLW